jgi:hypothetical protein
VEGGEWGAYALQLGSLAQYVRIDRWGREGGREGGMTRAAKDDLCFACVLVCVLVLEVSLVTLQLGKREGGGGWRFVDT